MTEFLLLLICVGVTLATGLGFMVIFGLAGLGFLSPVFLWINSALGFEDRDHNRNLSGTGN